MSLYLNADMITLNVLANLPKKVKFLDILKIKCQWVLQKLCVGHHCVVTAMPCVHGFDCYIVIFCCLDAQINMNSWEKCFSLHFRRA